jgi:hypothetical protein
LSSSVGRANGGHRTKSASATLRVIAIQPALADAMSRRSFPSAPRQFALPKPRRPHENPQIPQLGYTRSSRRDVTYHRPNRPLTTTSSLACAVAFALLGLAMVAVVVVFESCWRKTNYPDWLMQDGIGGDEARRRGDDVSRCDGMVGRMGWDGMGSNACCCSRRFGRRGTGMQWQDEQGREERQVGLGVSRCEVRLPVT